jgi:hypothetical protein
VCSHLHCRDGNVSFGPPPVTSAGAVPQPAHPIGAGLDVSVQKAIVDNSALKAEIGETLREAVFCLLCGLQRGLAESGDEARGGVGTASHLKRNRAAPCPLGCDTAGGMPISTFRRLEECFETASSGVSLYLDTFNLLPSSTCVPLVVNRGWVPPLQHGGHVVEPFRCHHGAGVDPHHTWPELRR